MRALRFALCVGFLAAAAAPTPVPAQAAAGVWNSQNGFPAKCPADHEYKDQKVMAAMPPAKGIGTEGAYFGTTAPCDCLTQGGGELQVQQMWTACGLIMPGVKTVGLRLGLHCAAIVEFGVPGQNVVRTASFELGPDPTKLGPTRSKKPNLLTCRDLTNFKTGFRGLKCLVPGGKKSGDLKGEFPATCERCPTALSPFCYPMQEDQVISELAAEMSRSRFVAGDGLKEAVNWRVAKKSKALPFRHTQGFTHFDDQWISKQKAPQQGGVAHWDEYQHKNNELKMAMSARAAQAPKKREYITFKDLIQWSENYLIVRPPLPRALNLCRKISHTPRLLRSTPTTISNILTARTTAQRSFRHPPEPRQDSFAKTMTGCSMQPR